MGKPVIVGFQDGVAIHFQTLRLRIKRLPGGKLAIYNCPPQGMKISRKERQKRGMKGQGAG